MPERVGGGREQHAVPNLNKTIDSSMMFQKLIGKTMENFVSTWISEGGGISTISQQFNCFCTGLTEFDETKLPRLPDDLNPNLEGKQKQTIPLIYCIHFILSRVIFIFVGFRTIKNEPGNGEHEHKS